MELNQLRSTYGGLRGLLDVLWRIHLREKTSTLGIVIGSEGSTYQKPGALVLLDADGIRHGVISGGCLEPALEDAAREVYATGRAVAVEFDTRSDEDVLFGSGIGCRGRLRMLLLPLPPRAPLARALFAALDAGAEFALSLVAEGPDIGAGHAEFFHKSTMQHERFVWNAQGSPTDAAPTNTLELRIAPPPRLLLLGAGPETPPLVAAARRLGWFVTVVEHRGRWLEFAREAQPDRLLELAPDLAAAQLAGERTDAVLAMSHNYSLDLSHLAFAAQTEAGYVGLLGPAARRDELLGELDAHSRTRLTQRLHAPVGLALGGHGAEAIALAIAAELHQHFCAPNVAAAAHVVEVVHA